MNVIVYTRKKVCLSAHNEFRTFLKTRARRLRRHCVCGCNLSYLLSCLVGLVRLCNVPFFFPSHSGHFLLPSISEKCNLIAACVCPSLSVFDVGLGSRFYRIMDSPFGSNLAEIKHDPFRGILKIVMVSED